MAEPSWEFGAGLDAVLVSSHRLVCKVDDRRLFSKSTNHLTPTRPDR